MVSELNTTDNVRYPVSEEDMKELEVRFTYHPPTPEQVIRYRQLRDMALAVALEIKRLTPVCREQSLALTHLDDLVTSANAAIARRE